MHKKSSNFKDKLCNYNDYIDNQVEVILKSKPEICDNTNCKAIFYLPCYNSSSTLKVSLQSILDQKTEHEYCIVVYDDGSEERTIAELKKFQKQYGNLRIFFGVRNHGILMGTRIAREIALKTCQNSEYLALGSDHDVWSEDFLHSGISDLENAMDCDLWVPQFTENLNAEKVKANRGIIENKRLGKLSSIRSCRAGRWMYGIERRTNSPRGLFYPPIIGPDQLYVYSLVANTRVFQSDKVFLNFNKKLNPNSQNIDNLIRLPFRKKYFLYSQSKVIRLRTHLHVIRTFQNRSKTFILLLYCFVFSYKNSSIFSKIKFKIKVFTKKLLTKPTKLVIGDYTLFKKLITAYRTIIRPTLVKEKNNPVLFSNTNVSNVGLIITTPGALRLLDFGLRELLQSSRSTVNIKIYMREGNWQKKLNLSYVTLLKEWNALGRGSVELVFFPKYLDLRIQFLARLYGLSWSRLKENSKFYQNHELLYDVRAAKRSHKNFETSLKSISFALIIDLARRAIAKLGGFENAIREYFNSSQTEVMLYAPIVNSYENEIVVNCLQESIINLGIVLSWDNLTVKGKLIDSWDRYLTWGPGQQDLLSKLHKIDPSKVRVCGPYPFRHLARSEYSKEKVEHREKILWALSSSFIAREQKTEPFSQVEVVTIVECLKEAVRLKFDKVANFHFRLHPNSEIEVEKLVDFINREVGKEIVNMGQFSKGEPITIVERAKYVELLQSSKVMIALPTSSVVEAALLGISTVIPPNSSCRDVYKEFWHSRLLTSNQGGPAIITSSWREFFEEISLEQAYRTTGFFENYIGSRIDLDDAVMNFTRAIEEVL
jgi:glycosyltransferase involved in cell wall biosynthesis